ncbi:hypothetical protein Tco_1304111 [Tanacetum coccineum]
MGRPFLATIHAQIDVFKRESSLGIGKDRVKFDMDGGVCHSRILVEKIYMANSVHEEEYFNPLEIEDDVYSYESPACLLFEQRTQAYDNKSVDTLELANNMQELEDKHEDMVRYGNKNIDDTTRERRYYEWVAQNNEFKDNDSSHEATISMRAQYPWYDEGFEEEERWESGIEKTDYEPPFVDIETFKIKRYSFKGGRSFICIAKQLDDALPLGRVNGSRFIGMIRKEMDEEG